MSSDPLRIVWLKTGPLHPLDTGGKIRTFNMLRTLKRENEITYVSLCPPQTSVEAMRLAGEYSPTQRWIPWREAPKRSAGFAVKVASNVLFSGWPFVIQKYSSRQMAAVIRKLDEAGNHDLIVCDFLTPAVNLFGGFWRPKLPTLLFQHNVESLIWKRLFENAAGLKRMYFRNQWQRLEKFERETCARFNGVVGVSEEDCEIFRREFCLTNVLGAVPTGVDCECFHLSDGTRKPASLVFLGSMDWMPNIDAVEFFTGEIWPLVKRQFPKATFTIVGRNPPRKVRELEQRAAGVRVTGTVDDVRPFLAEAAVMIVPLRVGGGTRIKIFEGMATGIPVVSTRIGAEGLPVTHGENILLAEAPQDFAAQIAALFADPERAARIGASGRALVQSQFSWESVNRIFVAHCQRAYELGRQRRAANSGKVTS
jgi:glycosyltransferase involved in cell wall biosynthesis